MNNCLVLVDLQNDYFPGGKMELVGIGAAAENFQLLLTEFRKTKAPIIHVQHISLEGHVSFMAALSFPYAKVVLTKDAVKNIS
jgi:nicotinamidase-related amidase